MATGYWIATVVDYVAVPMLSVFMEVDCDTPRLTYDYELHMTIVDGLPNCKLPAALRAAVDTALIRMDMERRAIEYDREKLKGGP